MSKVKGTILLEVIVSIAILMLSISTILKISMNLREEGKRSTLNEELLRTSYCIMQELKYNYTFEEVSRILNSNIIYLNYNNEVLNYLVENELFSLAKGDEISIKIVESKGDYIKINITINFENDKEKMVEVREFLKYRWMDEI